MQQATVAEGVVAFPDWAFANLPRNPTLPKRAKVLHGSRSTAIRIGGRAKYSASGSNSTNPAAPPTAPGGLTLTEV